MGKVHLLDSTVSELIAAGEVIERPASIIKELLENAIDAHATAITVEIQNGGISYLRITDNGDGFESDDVPTAFLRHATSKVRDKEDLNDISTLGFRGEALASICAVSKIELVSKTKEARLGTCISIYGGIQQSLDEIGCASGTTIVVRDLFYNVPARLKFLKKDVTEGNAIQSIMEKIALSHPEISFKLIKDRKLTLHSPGSGNLLDAIYAVLGKEFADSLIELNYEHQGIRISGYITKPSKCRKNRTMQHFFVNHRYVKSTTCTVSLDEAYQNTIMVGKFPGCVLKLKIGYHEVDVNVHPAKIEVRFIREKAVFETVYFAVKSALSKADILTTTVNDERTFISKQILPQQSCSSEDQMSLAKSVKPEPEKTFQTMQASDYQKLSAPTTERPVEKSISTVVGMRSEGPKFAKEEKPLAVDPAVKNPQIPEQKTEKNLPIEDHFQFLDQTSFIKKEMKQEEASPLAPITIPDDSEHPPIYIKMIGELFKTYILFEANDAFVMIDKHAAHERILYEKLKEQIDLRESQLLLTPKKLLLSTEEKSTLEQEQVLLQSFGFRFDITPLGIAIVEAPVILHQYDIAEIVNDIVNNLLQKKFDVSPDRLDDLLHSIACRAAIKANANNTIEELQALVEQVYIDDRIRHCPHGRPVGFVMTKYEVEKKFGRH